MNVKQLKDFCAKLKCAKELCAEVKFNAEILCSYWQAELSYQCADAVKCHMPNDVYEWYTHPTRTPAEREAMWNNSIAAVDAQIAKGK